MASFIVRSFEDLEIWEPSGKSEKEEWIDQDGSITLFVEEDAPASYLKIWSIGSDNWIAYLEFRTEEAEFSITTRKHFDSWRKARKAVFEIKNNYNVAYCSE